MPRPATLACTLLLCIGACAALPGRALEPVRGPLDRPAQTSPLAVHGMLLTAEITSDGRWVAAGERGHVVVSFDRGRSWKQAAVPTSVSVTAVDAHLPGLALAVGHGLTILRSTDGGQSWTKALDGRELARRFAEWGKAMARPDQKQLAHKLQRLAEDGADKPLLDVLMLDERSALAIGAYGVALFTEDGGRSWGSAFDRFPAEEDRHFNAICRVGRSVWVAGERGLLYRSDDGGRSFRAVKVSTQASLFAVAGRGNSVVAVGLRGAVVASADGGLTWDLLRTSSHYSFMTVVPDPDVEGVYWAGDESGGVWRIDARRRTAASTALRSRAPIAALLIDPSRKVTAFGLLGVDSVGDAPAAAD